MTTQVRSIYSIPSIPSVTLRQGVIRFTEIFASMMDGWVVGCCGTGLACISAVLCRRLCRSTTEPFYLLFFWFALTAAGTISALWLAAFFPAIMSPDSMSQWGQAVAWKLTDWHPIGMTLLMRAVHIAFGGLSVQGQVAVLTWLQGTAFWFSIFAMLGLANLPVRAKVLASAGVALYYPIWLYTVTLWKDVWFAIALFWMVFFGYRAFLGERTWWKSGWLLLPPLVFAVLNRYTASLSFVFLAAAISPIIWINLGKRRLVANCIFWLSMVVTALGIQKALYESFNVEDIGSTTNGIALFEVAGTAHLAEMTESNWQELHTPRVLGKDRFAQAVKLYRCGAPIDYLIYQPGHPLEPSDLLQQDVAIKDLLTVARKHPVAYLMHRGCSVLRLLGVRGEEESPFLDIWPNQFGIRASSLWPGAHRAVLGWEWRSTQYAALRWPFHHYLFLIASGLVSLLAVSRLNFPNKHLVYCLFVAGVAVLFPLLIVTPASDWRYLMPADVCWVCSTLIGVGDGLLLMDQSHGAGRDQALRTVGNRSN